MDLLFQDTICAISTAPGVGGIAVIRVSGKKATEICNACVSVDVMAMKANTCRFARFVRPNGEVLDEVMLTLFKAPHSFTGEDTIEIACHGSQYIQQCILQDLVAGGARLARAGEFTQRAFLNGKMDLSQAEAVADLIASTSRAAHRIALKQMRGGFSDELSRLRSKLLDFTSLVELELDFADHEELEFADRSQLQALAIEIESKISRLTQSFSLGNAIKNGIPVAIVGKTNAGKSTLLNALVGEEKAIVSDIHGTTRDVIEDCISIDGIQFRFFDTAGLRETDDEIESLGIARSYRSIDKAQIVLWLIDSAELLAEKANAGPSTDEISKLTASDSAEQTVAGPSTDEISKLTASDSAELLAEKAGTGPSTDEISKVTASNSAEQTVARPSTDEISKLTASDSAEQTDTINFDESEIAVPEDKTCIVVFNKIDKVQAAGLDISSLSSRHPHCLISAKQGLGIDHLRQMLIEASQIDENVLEDVTVSNARHYENLTRALDAIRRVKDGLQTQLPGDLLSMDLRECIDQLGAITGGALATDEILGNIFSKFCIGK
ncbi:MAG: tRNA uridine-5-carboxymethylaminomethyl(34) synthesis GTPase MnmE [Bacteroidales bacterium]|nr:tRNA uridine-5-carboxymethylaminomethyl(34) synthesis GTPase MnmE [Bacteroidales bacterium]